MKFFVFSVYPENEGRVLSILSREKTLKDAFLLAKERNKAYGKDIFRVGEIKESEYEQQANYGDEHANHAADAVGVTKHSNMRVFVVQAVKYALERWGK